LGYKHNYKICRGLAAAWSWLCVWNAFSAVVYQYVSRRISNRVETMWVWSVVSVPPLWVSRRPRLTGGGAWEVGGGSYLCPSQGRGAGLAPLSTPAHHCGGTPVRRRRTGAGRRPTEPSCCGRRRLETRTSQSSSSQS